VESVSLRDPQAVELRIRVHAVGVPIDLKIRTGCLQQMLPQFPITLGDDFPGVVVEAVGL
jgi:NADPH:quinone reductase-like Zn-dependent oxidoreductase